MTTPPGETMDWYLSAGDATGERALRHQIRDYLSRHGEPGADVDSAELIAHELVTNAQEHAAGPVWVRLSWRTSQPLIEVWDLGSGFALPSTGAQAVAVDRLDPSAMADAPVRPAAPFRASLPGPTDPRGRGLFLVTHLASDFDMAARRGGGTRVAASLPVPRAVPHQAVPKPPLAPFGGDPLPDLSEVDEGGGFGKEAFLRALVVQLSQSIEYTAGPAVGEDVVTQVGLTVGGQMEAAYRAAHLIADRLTPEQLADCYVQLKHAIDGQFRVVEISDERIVLDNSRCPFGNAVRKAPALCRMTSSVFGGIAARNRDDGASVVLEERIAVGDPGCRVVVYLGPAPADAARFAHPYPSLSAAPTA